MNRTGRVGGLALVAAFVLSGCLQSGPKKVDQSTFAPTERRTAALASALRQQNEAATISRPKKRVQIQGEDILLPEATPDQLSGEHSYYFDIAIDDESNRPALELVQAGILRIQVVGADATVVKPEPTPSGVPQINSAKVRLKVSTNKEGVLRPFTIRAWYPAKADEQWSDSKHVKVYYGDIRTRVQIVGRTEAEGMFGRTFADHFHVGRVFLRNRSASKSLAVYTTSMRVPVLFYRKSELPGGLTPAAAERLREQAGAAWGSKKVTIEAGRVLAAENLVHRFLYETGVVYEKKTKPDTYRDPYVREAEARDPVRPAWVTEEEKDALVARVLAEWARLAAIDNELLDELAKLTQAEREDLVDAALVGAIPGPHQREEDAKTRVTTRLGNERLAQTSMGTAKGLVRRMWQLREEEAILAKTRGDDAARKIADVLRLVEERRAKVTNEGQQKFYESIGATLKAWVPQAKTLDDAGYNLLERQLADRPKVLEKISNLLDQKDREVLETAANSLPDLVREVAVNGSYHDFLIKLTEGSAVPRPIARHVQPRFEALRQQALRGGTQGLFADNVSNGARVSPGDFNLALSPDPHLQRQLIEAGYLWRDAYRPMTFQSVLSAVMFTHKNNPRTVWVEGLEALATVFGGAVGLSGDLSSGGTIKAANFFSSVFVPTLRKTIVEDLNKHITNLGEMAMDTVVIIPPNDSVDRYVFFPRGPIYNFPDDFDPTSPAYIMGIEGQELFVEAVPINSDQVVRGGAVDANTLVTRALNEGERSESARLLQVAQTQARLRTMELANLSTKIKSLLEAANKKPEGPERDKAVAVAEEEIRRMTAAFTAYFGPDQSGTLAATLAEHGVSAFDAAPVVLKADELVMLLGTRSRPWPIYVSDPPHDRLLLRFERKDKDGSETWLSRVTFDTGGARFAEAVFEVNKTPLDGLKPPLRKEVTLIATDGAGNKAEYKQPVQLQPVEIELPTGKVDDGADIVFKRANAGDGFEATVGKARTTITVTAPYFHSDATLLALRLQPVAPGADRPSVEGEYSTVEKNKLQLRIELDTSATAADDLRLVLPVELIRRAPWKAEADDVLKTVQLNLTL